MKHNACGCFLLICETSAGIVGIAQVLRNSLLCQGANAAESVQDATLLGVKTPPLRKAIYYDALPRCATFVPTPQIDS